MRYTNRRLLYFYFTSVCWAQGWALKTAEAMEIPFRGGGWLTWAQGPRDVRESRSDESIRRIKGWQDGNMAFRQNLWPLLEQTSPIRERV